MSEFMKTISKAKTSLLGTASREAFAVLKNTSRRVGPDSLGT